MGIMAMDTQMVLLLAVPIPCPLAVNTVAPIPVLRPVALAAQLKGAFKGDYLSVTEREKKVAFVGMVAVQAPDSNPAVLELDVGVNSQSFRPRPVYFEILLGTVARATGCYGLGQLLDRNRKLLLDLLAGSHIQGDPHGLSPSKAHEATQCDRHCGRCHNC